MSFCDDFRGICRADVPLADLTWYRLGGPARWVVEPREPAELAAVVARCRRDGLPWRVLGRGANVLVRDEGFDGVVVRLVAPAFEAVEIAGDRVRAGAGADFPRLIRTAIAAGLGGLEALAGVPGTLGGLVRMNAGGRHGCLGDFVREACVLEADGTMRTRSADQIGFGYRSTDLAGCVVLEAAMKLAPADPAAALARHRDIWNEKHASQPPVSQRSAGCIFKNRDGVPAGRLLDEAGLKGARAGGAEISPRHANFIVAGPGATARDVLELIALARDRVWNASGVELELEIEVW